MTDLTGWDIAFLSLAALQLIAMGLLAAYGVAMLGTMKKAQRRAQPAINEARALAQMGLAMATHTRDESLSMAARVKGVVTKVRARVETTKRIVGELKPHGRETALAARETRAAVARRARQARDVGFRLLRLKNAAEAAAKAAAAAARQD